MKKLETLILSQNKIESIFVSFNMEQSIGLNGLKVPYLIIEPRNFRFKF